ncbi:MAG: PilW family protein [Gammaproteobacteria bacterium]
MRKDAGFTIIEFMIAMTLSLLVLAALTAAFVASSRSRAEIEKANEQIENGRFALQILTDDLEMAGFLSHLDLDLAMTADNPLTVPGAKPAPCVATLAALRANLPMHMQGYNSLSALTGELSACLTDFKEGTDIILVRRVATCVRGVGDCTTVANAPYFQATLCDTHLKSLDAVTEYFKLDTTLGNLNRTTRDCATAADQRQFLVHIYYVANSDIACATTAACAALGVVGQDCVGTSAIDGDCIPTLKRAELVKATGTPADDFTIVPLAHGIEDLQVEYGIDTSGDGAPDAFTSDPDTYDAPGGAAGPHADCAAHATECVSNWRNVMAMRLHLLARNSSETRDHTDTKIYMLGQNDDGTDRCARDENDDGTCEAFGGGFKRHVYQTSVRLMNPAGRRES